MTTQAGLCLNCSETILLAFACAAQISVYCDIAGLETLQVAVTYWEDAVMKMGYLDDNPLPAITVGTIIII